MQDEELIRLVELDTPKLNPKLAGGLATEQMQFVEKYIDDVFRSAAKGFPPGLTYTGCQRCSPAEEFSIAVRNRQTRNRMKRHSRRSYETSRSDIYLMKYHFRYNGEEIPPCYIYVPFVGQAGAITISGSNFNIAPVLSDRVISIGAANIFVRVLRDRITFQRTIHSYDANGRNEAVRVVHSLIHHKNSRAQKIKPTIRALTTMVHYLFAKYGFTETFRRYAKCVPIVVTEYNPSQYPEDEYVVCRSTGVKPKGYGRGGGEYYERTPIMLIFKKEEYTKFVKALVAGFYYVVDHFPKQMNIDWLDQTRQWMILMGQILFSGNNNVGRLYDSVASHIESLDHYVDKITQAKMQDIGIDVPDIYDFFAIIIEHFNDWLLSDSDKINTMYDKELMVLYYALFDITEAIFNFHFNVKAAAKKELTVKDIKNIMNATLRVGLVFGLAKKYTFVASNSYSGDNMAFKITSALVPQSETSRMRKGGSKRGATGDPLKKLHVSIAEVGSYSGMRKSEPTGRNHLNLHVNIDSKGLIIRDEELRELLDETQEMIR